MNMPISLFSYVTPVAMICSSLFQYLDSDYMLSQFYVITKMAKELSMRH